MIAAPYRALRVERVDPDLAQRYAAAALAHVHARELGYDDEIVEMYRAIGDREMADIREDVTAALTSAPSVWAPPSLARAPLRAWAALALTDGLRMVLGRGEPMAPAYPGLPEDVAAAVAVGMPLADATGLTAAEAHEWASGTPDMPPGEWLLRRAGMDGIARSVGVARWAIACCGDARVGAFRARVLPHLDLVAASDVLSPSDGVRSVETRGEIRRLSAVLANVQAPSWERGRRRLRCVRPLRDAESLVMWSRRLHNCLHAYPEAVAAGRSHVYAVTVTDGQGTLHVSAVELDPSGRVVQHHGDQIHSTTAPPPPLCARALQAQLRVWGLG